jgi:hypothetical protein
MEWAQIQEINLGSPVGIECASPQALPKSRHLGPQYTYDGCQGNYWSDIFLFSMGLLNQTRPNSNDNRDKSSINSE